MEKNNLPQARRFNAKAVGFLFLIIAVIIIVLLLQDKDSSITPSRPARPNPGQAAPNFSFPGLDGKIVTLADYRGKVVLLNIWATWCPSCVEEMPSLEKLHRELGGTSFTLLAASIDQQGANAVLPFMRNHRLTFPALLADEDLVQRLYGITGVPESFIIDKEGIIAKVVIGPVDWAAPEMVSYLRKLL